MDINQIISKLIIKNFIILSAFKNEIIIPIEIYANTKLIPQNQQNTNTIITNLNLKNSLLKTLKHVLTPKNIVSANIDEVDFKVDSSIYNMMLNGNISFSPRNKYKKEDILVNIVFSKELNKKRTYELYQNINGLCEVAFPVLGYWGEHEYSVMCINVYDPQKIFDVAYEFMQDSIVYGEHKEVEGNELEINILTNKYYKRILDEIISENQDDYLKTFSDVFKTLLNQQKNVNNLQTIQKIEKYFSKVEDDLASIIYDSKEISEEEADKLYNILKHKEENLQKNIKFTINYDVALYDIDHEEKTYKKGYTFKKMSIRHDLSIKKESAAIPHKEYGFSHYKKHKSGHFMNLSEKLKRYIKNLK